MLVVKQLPLHGARFLDKLIRAFFVLTQGDVCSVSVGDGGRAWTHLTGRQLLNQYDTRTEAHVMYDYTCIYACDYVVTK